MGAKWECTGQTYHTRIMLFDNLKLGMHVQIIIVKSSNTCNLGSLNMLYMSPGLR